MLVHKCATTIIMIFTGILTQFYHMVQNIKHIPTSGTYLLPSRIYQ